MKTFNQFINEDHSLKPKTHGDLEARKTDRNERGFKSGDERKRMVRRKVEVSVGQNNSVREPDRYSLKNQKSKKRKDIKNRQGYLKTSTTLTSKQRKSDPELRRLKEDTEMKTFDQLLTEVNHTNKAISIAARLKGGINRLKAKIPGTQANKFQNRLNDVLKVRKVKESELDEGRAKLGAGAKAGNRLLDGPNRKTKKAYKQGNIAKANHNFDNSLDRKDARSPIKYDRTLTNHIKKANANSVAVNNWKRKLKEDELDEGRARYGKFMNKVFDLTPKTNRKVNRAFKATKKDPNDGPAKLRHYNKTSRERQLNRLNKMSEDEQLGPNAEMVQQVKRNLKLESIKPLAHGKIEKVGNVLRLRSTVGGKVTKKQHTIKEQDHEDDIEYAIRSKAPAPKPVKEAESTPKPEPKKVNRLKYFLDRAKKKETIGERDE